MAAKGGRRPGAGRPKGSRNKVANDLREAAQKYTAEALETLAHVMKTSESDASRVAAATALLDRGHGRPAQKQDIDLNVRHGLVDILAELGEGEGAGLAEGPDPLRNGGVAGHA